MDIYEKLLEVQSNKDRIKIAKFIGKDPSKFNEAVMLILIGDDRFVIRAFLTLNRVLDKYPNLILPHVDIMVARIEQEGAHVAYKRNVMRFLQYIDIPEHQKGRVLDLAMLYLIDPKEAIAVKVFSMQVALNLSLDYPNLLNELKLIIQDMIFAKKVTHYFIKK